MHQNFKNAVHTKLPSKSDKKCQSNQILFLQSACYTSEGRTCKVLPFYDFWFKFYDKFCGPSSDFYAYLITKVETLASNELSSVLLKLCHLVERYTVPFICMFYNSFDVEYTVGVTSQRECSGSDTF